MSIDTLVVVLAGGEGSRLRPLTKFRTKPAVTIGAKYRLIDIPLSNAFKSNLRQVLVLTQGKDNSLNKHIKDTWHSDPKYESFVETISPDGLGDVYDGDADAVRQIRKRINDLDPNVVLIVPGDHLLKMDYAKFIHFLKDHKADAAISVIPKQIDMARHLGSIGLNNQHKIVEFKEKDPNTPLRVKGQPDMFYASMGIYAFKKDRLLEALELKGNLFGKHTIPQLLDSMHISGYDYIHNNLIPEQVRVSEGGYFIEKEEISKDSNYWRDVGTIGEYFEANMDLVSIDPKFNLYGKRWKFFTYHPEVGPSKTVNASDDAIIGEGSIITNIRGRNLVISPEVYVDNSNLEDVIIFNRADVQRCKITRTIIDKDTKIRGMEIGYDIATDEKRGIYVDPESGVRVVQKGYESDNPKTWMTQDEILELKAKK